MEAPKEIPKALAPNDTSDTHKSLLDVLYRVRADFRSQAKRILPDVQIVLDAGEAALKGGRIDDRNYLVRLGAAILSFRE